MTNLMTRRELVLMLGTAALAVPAFAADETLKGELVCAKCYLNREDAKECQDVLLVKNTAGDTVEYYVTKNQVSQESGEACTDKIPATIIGTVSEKDGRKWVTASKITKAK
jgi:uncharacterized protein DUF6370